MLERNELGKYGPPGFHLAQKEKDYVQHWILTFLSRSGFGGVFKGGTCLQKAFGMPRYSEDIDFTLNKAEESDMDALAAFLSAAGFAGVVWKRDETEISVKTRLRYRGPLYNGSEISEGTVLLEFSRREKTALGPNPTTITPPYPDILPYQILVMDREEIAAEKIRAILTRSSARDLFDLYFLMHQKTRLDRKIVAIKLGYYDMKYDQEAFVKSVKKLDRIWKTEMAALTPAGIGYETAAKLVLEESRKQLSL